MGEDSIEILYVDEGAEADVAELKFHVSIEKGVAFFVKIYFEMAWDRSMFGKWCAIILRFLTPRARSQARGWAGVTRACACTRAHMRVRVMRHRLTLRLEKNQKKFA